MNTSELHRRALNLCTEYEQRHIVSSSLLAKRGIQYAIESSFEQAYRAWARWLETDHVLAKPLANSKEQTRVVALTALRLLDERSLSLVRYGKPN